jgi:thymidylate synthase ThyX
MEDSMKKTTLPIDIRVVSVPSLDKEQIARFAAETCYRSTIPELGKSTLDVDKQLTKTGHHTTLEHSVVTFAIEGIAISDITFGLHLVNVFYNSDQRSGRYCKKMFENPNVSEVIEYIKYFYDVSEEAIAKITSYVEQSISFYFENIDRATEVANVFLKEERPYISEENLKRNAPRIAQEQLRMLFPTIFGTAMVFTIDDITLASMYYSAWSPVMRSVTEKMVSLYLEKYPHMKYLFDAEVNAEDWSPEFPNKDCSLLEKPRVSNLEIRGENYFVPVIKPKHAHPFDLLQFSPFYMKNKKGRIENDIEISVATMGQDQRHRTIDRGDPIFTGNFYIPPILNELCLKEECLSVFNCWKFLRGIIPDTLFTSLAPYGAMVSYRKSGNFNAIVHEQGKRLCWCAQEEIYHVGLFLRKAIIEKLGVSHKLVSVFEPPCYRGVCTEGDRFCGRDIKIRESGDYFPERRV